MEDLTPILPISHCERETGNGKMELVTFKKTLSSSSQIEVDKTSKPGPKSIANECIIPLTILLKRCYKCSEKCRHKHHPSVYRCIADLFNACGIEGRTNWNSEEIEKRYGRIKKNAGLNEEWWYEHSKNQLAMSSNFHRETGLFELIQKYTH
jgi:hypothetical protein